MGLFDLADRLNWQQAASLLGVARSTFFSLVRRGELRGYGLERCRFYLRSEIEAHLVRPAAAGKRRPGRREP